MSRLQKSPTLTRALMLAGLAAVGFGAYHALGLRNGDAPAPRMASLQDWAATLSGMSGEGLESPSGPWSPEFPSDHGAHPGMRAETWSIVAHLQDATGADLGLQFALTRFGITAPEADDSPWALRRLFRAHLALAADGADQAASEERISRGALGVAGGDAARGEIWLDDWTLSYGRGADGDVLTLSAAADETAAALRLKPLRAASAVNAGGDGGPLRGYGITRLAVEGVVETAGAPQTVFGLAWLDHFWGELPLPGGPIAWDRLQIQFDDGTDLSVIRSRRRAGGGAVSVQGFIARPDGSTTPLDGAAVAMEATRTWRSADGAVWPVGWRLRGDGLDLEIEARADDRRLAFAEPVWIGVVAAEGRIEDRRVSGVGTLNLTGYAQP